MLNDKQKRFCEEYIIDLNATQAAIRAGYSAKTANEQAGRLLVNVSVQEFIAELKAERSDRLQITADDVLKEFWSIAQDDVKNYLSFKMEDEKIKVEVKDSATINTKNIQEISLGKDGQFKFKLYARDAALVNVGRHLGMFKDKLDTTTDFNVNMNL